MATLAAMEAIKCVNRHTGEIEFATEYAISLRDDLIKATPEEVYPEVKARMVAEANQQPRLTLPDILAQVKSAQSVDEVNAILAEHGDKQEVATVAARRVQELGGEEPVKAEEDDLTQINNVGPAAAQALKKAGILTFRQFADAETSTLRGLISRKSNAQIEAMQMEAEELAL